MVDDDTVRGVWSWVSSLFLNSGLLGISMVAVLWLGWPQPPIAHDDRVASEPELEKLSARQLSSTLVPGVSAIDGVHRSAVEREANNLPLGDSSILIDLNLGSRQELESLPGIGGKLADRIVSYRSSHGSFKHVSDVINVSGIGEKRLKRLEPFVTVTARNQKRAS